jgi:hypothetical protein
MFASVQGRTPFTWQRGFLELLPAIQRFARFAFRHLDPAGRDEAVAEATAIALVAYRRLVDRGRQSIAYASPLARYAVLHVRSGRRVGGPQDHADVLSRVAQQRHGFQVNSLHRADHARAPWVEKLVVEDRRATPADVAATRIDFCSWLATLPRRQREIARVLASGETTKTAARQFAVTEGRISQVRRELAESWARHQGETVAG